MHDFCIMVSYMYVVDMVKMDIIMSLIIVRCTMLTQINGLDFPGETLQALIHHWQGFGRRCINEITYTSSEVFASKKAKSDSLIKLND